MPNIEKKEIIDKITDKVEDKDLQMELLEDITDSFNDKEETVSKTKYDDLVIERDLYKKKYEDLQGKYISRFSESGSNSNSESLRKEADVEEEKKVVDIKSIFK